LREEGRKGKRKTKHGKGRDRREGRNAYRVGEASAGGPVDAEIEGRADLAGRVGEAVDALA
jgi:hypothetical protein